MDALVLKITPMMVLPDINPVAQQYGMLGADLLDSGDPGCIGVQAGKSHMILVTADLLRGYLSAKTVTPLIGTTVPYIFVRSLADAKARLLRGALLVEEALTPEGTREAVVVQHGQFMVLAEKVE
jgi:hypothetical protein